MRKKIIAYNRVEKPVLDDLQKDYDVHFFQGVDPHSDAAFLHHLQDTEGIIGLELPVDETLLKQAPQLKIISNVSVGYNNLNTKALAKRQIMATHTPDVLTDTVADTIFGLLLATARRIPELDQYVKTGHWHDEAVGPDYFGTDVHHKTLGIIGMGRIGQALAKRGHFGFDMPILYHSRHRKPDAEKAYQATYCSLPTLLKQSDFVCLITPLTAETTHLIGQTEFQLMKNSAIFVNGSRGATVDEQAMIQALQTGDIAGAGLDVFTNEPIETHNPLLTMKNTVTTPHIGSSTRETELKMSQLAATNLRAGLNGKTPPNLVPPLVP